MIFVGFGFVVAFLKFYGFSSVAVNMLIGAFVVQMTLIVRGFIFFDILGGERFPVNVSE